MLSRLSVPPVTPGSLIFYEPPKTQKGAPYGRNNIGAIIRRL